jgi:hypothetical protein
MWINSSGKKIFVDNKNGNCYDNSFMLSEKMLPWGGITLKESSNGYELTILTDSFAYTTNFESYKIADKLSNSIHTILTRRFLDNKNLDDIVLPGLGWSRYKI